MLHESRIASVTLSLPCVTPEEAIVRFFEETAALQDLPFDPLPEDLEANPKLQSHIEERRRRREAEGKK